jgi:DNA-directed RNA polymerase
MFLLPRHLFLANMLRSTLRGARLRRTFTSSTTLLRPSTAHHTKDIISETLAAQAAYAHGPRLEALPVREDSATPRIHKASFTILPSPIPDDRQSRKERPSSTPFARTQAELYPTTGLLDALSLISVCLRKRETTERGYEIFKRILGDVEAGRCGIPDAAVWGSVISGISALASPSSPASPMETTPKDERQAEVQRKTSEMWARRAKELVHQWEKLNGAEEGTVAGLRRGGEKVYQGWLRGLLTYVPPPSLPP